MSLTYKKNEQSSRSIVGGLKVRKLLLAQTLCSAALLSNHAGAQSATQQPASPAAAAPELETIIVTAQKRSEKLQQVPITISAFDAATLTKSGITSVTDLSVLVPGLVYSDVVGYGLPYLRGIGTPATGPGFENPVATYVDGVYYASQAGALLSLNNIASVEVDKGPQGTLFGRNATGGAIQIRTLAPSDQFGGKAEIGYGNYNTGEGQLYVTGGIAPDLAANLAVSFMDQGDGYGVNLANGKYVDRSTDFTLRTKLLYSPTESTSITLALDMGRSTGVPALNPAPGTIPQFGPPIAANPRNDYGYPQPFAHISQEGAAVTIDHDMDFATLTSITAFRHTLFNSLFDSTMTAEPGTIFFLDGKEPHSQASEELQLASSPGGVIDWVGGTYLYWERAGNLEPTLIGGDSFNFFGLPGGLTQAPDDTTYSAAIFGQGTYHLTSDTSVTVGLRFTDEYKDDRFLQNIPAFDAITDIRSTKNFTNLSWRFALQHDFASNMMGYISYSRGYKSGGFNDGSPYNPETLDSIEAGLKTELLDNRVRLNASAFYYIYDNIQTVTYPNGNLLVTNGAGAKLYGLDLDGEWAATQDFRVSGGLETMYSEFTSFPDASCSVPLPSSIVGGRQVGYGTAYVNCSDTGKRLPKTPDLTFSIAADYSKEVSFGKVATNVTYSYNSGFFGESDNRLRQPAYSVLNASVSIGTADDSLVLKLWGKNLSDSLYALILAAETNGDEIQYAAPRTFGATLTKKF
jgi:iron complex outermembrane receptor protein